jgi:hypothetical protein
MNFVLVALLASAFTPVAADYPPGLFENSPTYDNGQKVSPDRDFSGSPPAYRSPPVDRSQPAPFDALGSSEMRAEPPPEALSLPPMCLSAPYRLYRSFAEVTAMHRLCDR